MRERQPVFLVPRVCQQHWRHCSGRLISRCRAELQRCYIMPQRMRRMRYAKQLRRPMVSCQGSSTCFTAVMVMVDTVRRWLSSIWLRHQDAALGFGALAGRWQHFVLQPKQTPIAMSENVPLWPYSAWDWRWHPDIRRHRSAALQQNSGVSFGISEDSPTPESRRHKPALIY